jgi:hypothetical protein
MIIYNTTMDLISKEVSKEEEKQFSHRIQYQDIFLLWQPSCIFYPQKNIQWYIHLKIGFIQSVVSEKILISIVFSLGTNVKCRDHRTILLVRWFMVFNATFNISVISWQSVLLVEETGKPRENQWPVPNFFSHRVKFRTKTADYLFCSSFMFQDWGQLVFFSVKIWQHNFFFQKEHMVVPLAGLCDISPCLSVLSQHYVIKFVSHLGQVTGFLWVFLFPPPIRLTVTI